MSIRAKTLVSLVFAAAIGPACAATITTDAFVASVGPTIAFLDSAGRLALAQADDGRVRAFARAMVASQDHAGERLAGWRRAEATATARDESGVTLDHLGPVAGLVKLPYDVVADVTSFASPPLTGLPSSDRLREISRQDLARLSMRRGARFVDLYAPSQVAALEGLAAAYKDFILNGDDPILRRLAVDALPKTRQLLARARRL